MFAGRPFIIGVLTGCVAIALPFLLIDRKPPVQRRATNVDPALAAGFIDAPVKVVYRPNTITLGVMLRMPERELRKIDPIIMNLVVLRGIPAYAELDLRAYVETVDRWASMIERSLDLTEPIEGPTSPAFQHDPDLWRAGGMATALAGEHIGIQYTASDLDPADADQSFVAGLIDTKQGTCANMPVLYLGIAHRLGWPLEGIVAGDHMFCRWVDDDSYFNLEATNATSDGEQGSFATPSDQEYVEWLAIPARAVVVGSDMKALTRRELLAVFLQQRAAYFTVQKNFARATRDILDAHLLFPQNRDIFMFLEKLLARKAGEILSDEEHEILLRYTWFIGRGVRREMEAPNAVE